MLLAFAGLFVAAIWILIRHGFSARKQSLPFGPFLALGAILAFFFG
jgi:prepilin signal peptidase PulO-like enzyme (type II secretory pathway)